MADVFISYARPDRQQIAALAAALEAVGFSLWWDRSLTGGVEFSKKIERELSATKAVIVAWSASGNDSPWVRDEASLARDQNKLVAITLDGNKPPMGFRQFNSLDFSSSNEAICTEAFDKLVLSLKLRVNPDEQSGPQSTESEFGGVHPPPARAVAIALRRLSRQNIHWRTIATIVALLVIVVGVVFWRQTPIAPSPIAVEATDILPQSVAVLPFKNLSSDPEQVYFSDGVAGEILNALAQVRDLHVTAQSSSFQFREEDRDTQDVARRLGVAAIVDGSVQKLGDRIRVTAQLVDARSNRVVWSQKFEGEPINLFAIQDAVAAEIVGIMTENFDLSEASIAPTKRIDVPYEAYDMYLQAQALLDDLFAAGSPGPRWQVLPPAYELLTQAIDIAPDFALAYASRAEAMAWIGWVHNSGSASTMPDFKFPLPAEVTEERVDAEIEKALALGPDLAETLVSYRFHSSRYSSYQSFMQDLLTHVDEALRINPNHAKARDLRSKGLIDKRKFREGFEEAERAYRLDPLNTDIADWIFSLYFYFGDFENLDRFMNGSVPLANAGHALTVLSLAYAEYGKFENLVEFERSGAKIPPNPVTNWNVFDQGFGMMWGLGASYATLGIPEMAHLRLRDQYEDIFLIREGRYNEAIDYLEAEWAIRSDPEKFKELRQPEWRYRLFDIHRGLAFAYLFTADYKKIIALSQQTTQFDLEPEPPDLPSGAAGSGPWIETSYAYALYQTGADNADTWMTEYVRLLEDMLAQGIALPNYEYEYARALTIMGRKEEAFASLERAIDKGWRRWYFEVDPITAPLREMPEFEGLKARYDADIARMRKIVVKGLREQGFDIAD